MKDTIIAPQARKNWHFSFNIEGFPLVYSVLESIFLMIWTFAAPKSPNFRLNHKDPPNRSINHKVWLTPPHPPGGCLIRREDLICPFLASPAAALPRFWPVLALLLTCLALPPSHSPCPLWTHKSSDNMSSVNPRPLWFIGRYSSSRQVTMFWLLRAT